MPVVGQMTAKVKMLDEAAMAMTDQFEMDARKEWKRRDGKGETSMLEMCQQLGKRRLDKQYIGKRIEYLSYFDMDEAGTQKELRWCAGKIEDVSDGTWLVPGGITKCYKMGQAARVFWDAVPDCKPPLPQTPSTEVFAVKKWNKNCDEAWRMELDEIDYSL